MLPSLRRFYTPAGGGRLVRSAPVLVLAVFVATVASVLQTGYLDASARAGGSSSPLSALDQSVQDFLIRTEARAAQAGSGSDPARDPRTFITIVAIDERTIAELGAYGGGYPRRYHAQLVDTLLAAPPRVIAFDLGFFEPTADDELLAAAFDRARSLPLPTSIVLSAVGLVAQGHATARTADGDVIFDNSLTPLPLLAASADLALANIVPDDRGTIRTIPLLANVQGVERPSLGLATVAAYLRKQPYPDARSASTAQFAGRTIPLERDAALRIGYLGPPSQPYAPGSTFRVVSFVDVLRGRLDPSIWRGGLVLVGALGATGLADDYWTPTSDQGRTMAGVEIHANVAASIFSSRFLRESPPPWEVAIIFAIALLVALLTTNLGAVAGWIATALVLCACAAAYAWAFYAGGLLLPFATPLLTGVISFSASAGYRFAAEQRQARGLRAQAAHEFLHDPVTGLPNRVLLLRRLTDAIVIAAREVRPAAVLLFGIDRFRHVNESQGHQAGDLVLDHVARRLQAYAPPTGSIAHLGGDQFAVLLPGSDTAEASRIGLAIVELLNTPVLLNGQETPVSTSLGIVVYPNHGDDPATLLRRSELALSAAKHSPAGYAVYTTDQDDQAAERLALASALRRAIDDDELTLCFQPKVDCESGALVGVEALARWMHPRLGEVPPQRFVALAEQTGLIGALTRWALNAALCQSRLWLDAGLALPIAVNLSALDAQDPSLPAAVADLLERWSVPAALLEVEITESALLGLPEVARDVLLRLESMGVLASLDDFGTGYSSLAYLKQFPVRELKIDRSFIADMAHETRDRTIVRSTIALGHSLGLQVVAEGVEDLNTFELLRELGCDLIQGYQVARPMPATELVQWIATRSNGAVRTPTAA
jgi:diguanylate cyclase (GGDEF)-like protein